MNRKIKTYIVVLLLIIFIPYLFYRGWYRKIYEFPQTDIVYTGGFNGDFYIGFINADSTNHVRFTTKYPYNYVAWSNDGHRLYLMGAWYWWLWQLVEYRPFRSCDYWGPLYDISDIYNLYGYDQLLINNGHQILLINPLQCTTIKRLIEIKRTQPLDMLLGSSLSSDEKYFLYSQLLRSNRSKKITMIRKIDLQTGVVTEMMEGFNPMWSPDDQWFAYLKTDGLYLMSADGIQNKQLLGSQEKYFFLYSSSNPHWSPDGKYIVYDRCPYPCDGTTTTNVYIFDVDRGIERLLVESGQYPYWRKSGK
jgi:Tol biopolymer transport system component